MSSTLLGLELAPCWPIFFHSISERSLENARNYRPFADGRRPPRRLRCEWSVVNVMIIVALSMVSALASESAAAESTKLLERLLERMEEQDRKIVELNEKVALQDEKNIELNEKVIFEFARLDANYRDDLSAKDEKNARQDEKNQELNQKIARLDANYSDDPLKDELRRWRRRSPRSTRDRGQDEKNIDVNGKMIFKMARQDANHERSRRSEEIVALRERDTEREAQITTLRRERLQARDNNNATTMTTTTTTRTTMPPTMTTTMPLHSRSAAAHSPRPRRSARRIKSSSAPTATLSGSWEISPSMARSSRTTASTAPSTRLRRPPLR